MSIPVSSVPSVISYLATNIKTQIASDSNASQILLTLADPGNAPDLPNEIINIGQVRRAIAPETFIGGGGTDWLNEKYDIECVVSCWTGSSDTAGALTIELAQVDRVWQLLGYVETVVRTDPSLGGLVDLAYPRDTLQIRPEWTDAPSNGLLVEVTFQIHVERLG